MIKYKDGYRRLVAQLLLVIFLFDSCTQEPVTSKAKESEPAQKEERSSDVAKEVAKLVFWETEEVAKNSYPICEDTFYSSGHDGTGSSGSHTKLIVDLKNLNSNQGFEIIGPVSEGLSGWSVSAVGDINDDGIADVIVDAYNSYPYNRTKAGAAYVIYGAKGGYSSAIDLSKLSNTIGFAIYGAKAEDYLGRSVSLAGDFNDDGIDDILIGTVNGSPKGRNEAGLAYIIYGVKGGYSSAIDLLHLPSTTGFAIYGARAGDGFGRSVNFAGDFNNDGISDVVIGAQFASYRNRANAGSSYVIYGTKGGYSSAIDLLHLSSAMGFRIDGATANDWIGGVGRTVSFAGDFNKDGIADIIIGGYNAAPSKRSGAGLAYVIYGAKGGYPAGIDLANLSSSMGFQIDGAVEGGALGTSVSQAGDINHDGIDDIIIGAPWASYNGKRQVGSSYVIYGVKAGYPAKIDLAKLCGSMGLRMDGGGYSVRSAKDVNSDGIDDVIIGVPNADRSYVVYGKQGGYNTVINLDNLRSTDGFEIVGASEDSACGSSVSQAGDINHDGIEDVIVGAMRASTNGKNQAGSSYVIYGTNLTAVSISTTNSNTEKRSNSRVDKLDATVSPASSVRPSWFSFEGWHTIFNALWSQPKLEKLTPRAEKLTKLQAKCVLMIAQANSKTADKWYQYSLEDLQEEMAAILKQPEMITEKTIKWFSRMLEGIDQDFLRAPLLEKPSFFAGIKNRIEVASCSPSNEGTLLHPSTQLMLGAAYVALTSSCFLDS